MPSSPQEIILTVDVALLTLVTGELHLALLRRDVEPFKGTWALPGGYIHKDEDHSTQDAAARVLAQKMSVTGPYLEEFGTFSGPARDPRGWSLTVVYFALVPEQVLSPAVTLFPVSRLPGLPFDHKEIVSKVVERVRSKASYSSLPVHLCAPEFTIPELHAIYEALLGETLALPTFRRKMDDLAVLEAVVGKTKLAGSHRPAQLYRVAKPFQQTLSVRSQGI
jgi:8-oxo-dGTP diphosphatase